MALKEIAVNVIKGNAKTNTKTKNKLKKHKNVICELTKSKNCTTKRKKLVIQSGGWLWIIPLMTSLTE